MHPTLGKLPGVPAIDPAPPEHLVVLITNDDADIGSKSLIVDHAVVIKLWIQNGKP